MNRDVVEILLVFSMLVCGQISHAQSLSYEDALGNCKKLLEAKKAANPSGFIYVGANCMEGAMLPEFEIETIEGEIISNSDLEGQVVVMNFWFVACQPCVAEIPGLQALAEKYQDQVVKFIAVAREDKGSVEQFLKKHTWEFDHVANEEVINTLFKISWGYPTTFVLNKNGEIIYASSGGYPDERAAEEVKAKLGMVIDIALND